MSQPIDLDLERLKRLPAQPDVWQLDVVRMPRWVAEEGRPPFRPLVPMCRSAAIHRLGTGELLEPGEPTTRQAFAAIASLAGLPDVRYVPTEIEVRDPALAEALRAKLEALGIELALVERLDGIDEVVDEMMSELTTAEAPPILYGGPGLGLARVRAFAEAAVLFHRAAPWNDLTDEDLLRVESPVPEESLRCLTVLGGGGIERGIGFYRSAADFARLLDERTAARFMRETRLWLFAFERIHGLAIPDSELWEEHGLPVAQEDAYPMLLCHLPDGTAEAPNGERLTFVEALLRALAASSEYELDSGRWAKSVTTFEGERTIELAIPALPEPPATPRGRDRDSGRGPRR